MTATFLLDDRTTSPCDAPGAEATAAFHVEDGKIVQFRARLALSFKYDS